MPFGEAFAVAADDEWEVREGWNRGAEGVENVDLARRVVGVVVAADDVGYRHLDVVDDDA